MPSIAQDLITFVDAIMATVDYSDEEGCERKARYLADTIGEARTTAEMTDFAHISEREFDEVDCRMLPLFDYAYGGTTFAFMTPAWDSDAEPIEGRLMMPELTLGERLSATVFAIRHAGLSLGNILQWPRLARTRIAYETYCAGWDKSEYDRNGYLHDIARSERSALWHDHARAVDGVPA